MNKSIKKIIGEILKGIAIGAGAILPGISSGVLCVIFGIYETLLDCTLNFFKNIKYNFKILFPIVFGIFIGIVLLGNVLKYTFYAFPMPTKFIFIGLILGEIPKLLKKVCTKQTFHFKYLIYLFVSFFIGILLVYFEKNISHNTTGTEYNYCFIIFAGFLMSAGVVIPGISSTLILMLLGIYDAYLFSVSTLYIPFLIPLLFGLILGSIICMKLIHFLLNSFHIQTFFSIIGFTLGSIFILYPGLSFDLNGALGLCSILLGLCFSNLI